MTWFLIGLALVALLTAPAAWIIGFIKRRRGVAVLATSLLLVFGMDYTVMPPPGPQVEMVRKQAGDDEPKD